MRSMAQVRESETFFQSCLCSRFVVGLRTALQTRYAIRNDWGVRQPWYCKAGGRFADREYGE